MYQWDYSGEHHIPQMCEARNVEEMAVVLHETCSQSAIVSISLMIVSLLIPHMEVA
jgi:hypothetical protein